MKCFSKNHFIAILFRKFVILKRLWFSNLLFIISSLGIVSISILLQYLRIYLKGSLSLKGSFSDISKQTNSLVFVNDSSFLKFNDFVDHMSTNFFKETGRKVPVLIFQNSTELNQFSYKCSETGDYILFFGNSISVKYNSLNKSTYYANLLYNCTSNVLIEGFFIDSIVTDGLWKTIYGSSSGFEYTNTMLTSSIQDILSISARLVIIFSAYSYFVSILLAQSINDVLGKSLLYMKSCGLTLSSYWLATFIIDFLFWSIFSILAWLLFIICKIPSFVSAGYYTLYSLVASGPSVLLFNYVIIHFLPNAIEAQKHLFFIFIGCVVSQIIIENLSDNSDPPFFEEILTSFIPPLSMYRSLFITSTYKYRRNFKTFKLATKFEINSGDILTKPQKFFFEKFNVHDIFFCHFIMDYINIIIYGSFLIYISNFLNKFNTQKVTKTYQKYKRIFNSEKLRAKNDMTEEALKMEEKVQNSNPNEFAIRINKVSRLFFDNDKKPILAVNSVSLGIKQGTLFGFLGVNGAGKTTLISMITSMLPASSGTIEINGENVNNLRDRTIISVCPQFNDHLIPEMTPLEHFILFSYIFNMNKNKALKKINQIISELHFQKILNKKLTEISYGDLRKLSVALAFFGPSKVIFLDEPTTSLDSASRDMVHKLILKNKDKKSILLCTHLLNEAETLCDQISIMNKGCIYTVDSPQNLNKNFGTSLKIDVFLNDNDDSAARKCTNFFNNNLPKAVLALERTNSRIYRISNKLISFPQLFNVMENGKKNALNGFFTFTCTSSSLEQTFLEIARLSENGDDDASISLLKAAHESVPNV